MRSRVARIVIAGALVGGSSPAQLIERISVSSAGEPANVMVGLVTRASQDGRFVAFTTSATNLVAGDVPDSIDAFVRDRELGRTVRVAPGGNVVDLTPDGRVLSYTLFEKLPGEWRFFAHALDLGSGTDTALSALPAQSYAGPLSADGRYMAYTRFGPPGVASPLVTWRRDLAAGTDLLISETLAGTPNPQQAIPDAISPDGSVVTFTSPDPGLVEGDTNGMFDAFLRDVTYGFTERVAFGQDGSQLASPSDAGGVSADLRYVLFDSNSPDVVPGDTNGTWDLFTYDRYLGEVRRVSVSSSGEQGNGATRPDHAWISQDGTRIVFDSQASNLVAGDTNGVTDVFEHDTTTGVTRRVVSGIGGAQPDGHVHLTGVTPDGRYLTVLSPAQNLVSAPSGGAAQAYLVDLGPQCYLTSYCSALPNSTGAPSLIQSTGTPGFALDNFVLYALDLPASATCVFFHGTERRDPPVPFGAGLACVGGTLVRLGTLGAHGGAVIQYQDLGSPAYAGVQPGDVRRFQLLYRDPAGGSGGFNTTNALEVTFCP